jgi:hypothetical protein
MPPKRTALRRGVLDEERQGGTGGLNRRPVRPFTPRAKPREGRRFTVRNDLSPGRLRGCGASGRGLRSRARSAHRRGALPPPALLRPVQSEGVWAPSDVRDTSAGTATHMPWRRDAPCGGETSPSGALGEGRLHVSDASCGDCGLRFSRAFGAVPQRCAMCGGPHRLDATAAEGVGQQQLCFEPPPVRFGIPWPGDGRRCAPMAHR